MLTNLHVKNLALIDEADVSFSEGLNILSGETGAGKSILIGSINIALGGKAGKDMIRTGKDSALIELVFFVNNEKVLTKLAGLGFYPEDGQIIISRKIFDNRSVCRVNGETVNLSTLRKLTSLLIDIHGQHEHQSLLKKSNHLDILDEFSKNQEKGLKEGIFEEYTEYNALKNKLDMMNLDEADRLREINFLDYEIEEIEKASLKSDEEEMLMAQLRKLSNSKHILNGLNDIYSLVGCEDNDGIGNKLGKAVKTMLGLCQYDAELEPIKDQIMDLEAFLSDFLNSLSDYRDGISLDDDNLAQVQSRLDLIHDLKRRYGKSVDDILAHLQENKAKKEELIRYDEEKNELSEKLQALEEKLIADCENMSRIRKESAAILQSKIKAALFNLNFLDVKFEISFKRLTQPSSTGIDDVEFLISTNVGEVPKPLEKVASGGELSRIMLAIKTVLAQLDEIDTLIFDEIDAGISGVTASAVASELYEIGRVRQVICISHLSQIVSMADTHFLIEKRVENEKTSTVISKLNEEQSIREVARLLGGANITNTTLENARELMSAKSRK